MPESMFLIQKSKRC